MTRGRQWLLAAAILIGVSGCATGEEWTTWQGHNTHFASGDHLSFSVRNREGRTARVTRDDIAKSGNESWWGKAITVSSEQILER
jgi:hypothetical protein